MLWGPRKLFTAYRRRLTSYESVLAYAVLGILGGAASGVAVLLFELAIREAGQLWGVTNGGEGFESLPRIMLFALPAGGAIVLGLFFTLVKPHNRETGIVHVISRMHSHYGILPAKNALVQFFGGVFALATGQSGGREGPGVHLGGAVNSLLGQWLHLPNNSLRMLIACGTAGGISAAFQTPLAGVIFAMEVIIAEYTVVGFIPVMLAAVSASVITHSMADGMSLFHLPALELNSLKEIPFIMLLGLCCGLSAGLFIHISKSAAKLSHWPVLVRFGIAGVLTGSLAYWVPEILGMGYDTLDLALQGKLALSALLIIAVTKLLATAVSCGVGMPIGLIGPNLMIGACMGGALGAAAVTFAPNIAADPVLYIVIGMSAAMGAVLNAPLAAILAVIELTQTINISMAAMLAIVIATLTNSGVLRQPSAHQSALRQLQRQVSDNPLNRLLHRTDVNSTMDTRIVRAPCTITTADMEPLIEFKPTWCLIARDEVDLYLVDGSQLLEWLLATEPNEAESVDVTDADIRRFTIAEVPLEATLRQALDTMKNETTEAVAVYGRSANTGKRILHGVVTRESIEKFTVGNVL
ncbi:MAG: chloride channel protein [Halioglobus sp.]